MNVPDGPTPPDDALFGSHAELETAHKAIEEGHAAFRRISGANDFYAAPLLLYSYGFERLLKVALFFRQWAIQSSRPIGEPFRRFGHRIRAMHDRLQEQRAEPPVPDLTPFVAAQMAEDDAWMQSPLALAFVDALDEFANGGRYHGMDRMLGMARGTRDATDLATKFENQVAEAYGIRPPADLTASLDPYYAELSAAIRGIARRYYRAVARLFFHGYLTWAGKRMSSGHMFEVALLRDERLPE